MPSYPLSTPLSADQRDLLDTLQAMEAVFAQFDEFLPAELILPRRPEHYQNTLEAGYAALGQAQTLLDTYSHRLAFERDRFKQACQHYVPTSPVNPDLATDPFHPFE
jgi:hypothetical protein